MSDKIKLIWEFRGPNSLRTAEHHLIHLQDFAKSENLHLFHYDVIKSSEMFATTYIVVDKKHMHDLRERLKPHRGQLYKEE